MGNKKRGFLFIKGAEGLPSEWLPKRKTKGSAGYDFYASETVEIPSIWEEAGRFFLERLSRFGALLFEADTKPYEKQGPLLIKPVLVKTSVKAYMEEDEVLYLYNRSSNPLKKGLVLANSVGVIDSDYFENPDNDGHIMFAFYNFGFRKQILAPGDPIGQGVFQKFLKADNDISEEARTGGFGSTDK